MSTACRAAVLVVAMLCAAAPLRAQRLDWTLRATLYGDNTEFFTPYRTGQTVLGGQVATWLGAAATERVTLRVGAFADRRWGSEEFTDSLKPILSARYQTSHGLGVIGTLETVRRHGLLDPLMISLRELTTPIEYGLQWRERRAWLDAEAWINWQQLNTPEQREGFEVGAVVTARATRLLTLEAQHLWSHRGGQLYDAGVPVTNNRVTALGIGVADSVPLVRHGGVQAFGIWSEGHLDPAYPAERPSGGHGLWLRGEVNPWPHWSLFAIHWRGTDFEAAAGDPNYGSVGQAPGFYRAERRYWELGAMRRVGVADEGVSFDTEVRLHRIDDEDSVAFFGTPWELSYRIVLRVPMGAVLRR
ncbi:MAG: hypothetical protein AB7N73_15575 [Gemmatimonadales bacterium]